MSNIMENLQWDVNSARTPYDVLELVEWVQYSLHDLCVGVEELIDHFYEIVNAEEDRLANGDGEDEASDDAKEFLDGMKDKVEEFIVEYYYRR